MKKPRAKAKPKGPCLGERMRDAGMPMASITIVKAPTKRRRSK